MRWMVHAVGAVLAFLSVQSAAQRSTFVCEQVEGPQKVKTEKIVGGNLAAEGDWPWQVAVFAGNGLCGGSLIHPQWVLTAAHCLASLGPSSPLKVRAGSMQLQSGGELIDAGRYFMHPGYNKGQRRNQDDIGLVKLQRPVSTPRAKVVQLQSARLEQVFAAPGACAVATGWGTTVEGKNDSVSAVLRQVDLPVVSRSQCDRSYPGAVSPNAVCAGYEVGTKDSCQGDSGGPLVVPGGPTGWTQAGVVSWGDGCAHPGAYGVYTRVAPYLEWIQQTVANNP